jgi:ZIP family zinc transporter
MTSISLEWTVALAWMAGLSIPIGALISSNVTLRDACLRRELDSFMSYFGGGALLAAVALVLIPRGIENASLVFVGLTFAAGGFAFWQFSAWADRTRNQASIFIAMLLDFIPEAILLGAMAANGSNIAYLLAGLIALQNMPEGFAAYHEMHKGNGRVGHLIKIFATASLAGPLAAWLGFVWLSSSEFILALILLFCSGGILYLIFEDIAPGAQMKHEHFPATGAVFGFLLGMAGTIIIH